MSAQEPSRSPDSTVGRVIDADPDLAGTLVVASLLGQSIILKSARAAGESSAEAQRTLVALTAALPKIEPDLTEEDVKTFIAMLAEALDRFGERDAANAEAINRALDAYRQQSGTQAEAAGLGDDVANIVTRLALAAALLLGEAKFGAEIPLPGGGRVTIAEGVPDKLQPLLDLVAKAVPGLAPGKQPQPDATAKAHEKPPGKPPQAGAGRTGSQSGASRKTGASGTKGPVQRADTQWMEYDEAIDTRDAVLDALRQKRILDFLTKDNPAIFAGQQPKPRKDIWGVSVPGRAHVTFSAGVFRAFADRPNDNRVQYRVGLRLQSYQRLTLKALAQAAADMDRLFPDQVSVRWTTAPILVTSNPEGRSGTWAVPAKDRFASGAPVNIPGGAVGSWTLGLHDPVSNKMFGLTVGHTIADDDGRGRKGTRVYCPPQGVLVDGRHEFGIVDRLEVFDAFDPLSAAVRSDRSDFALIELAAGRVPLPMARREAGTLSYTNSFADSRNVREARPRLIKLSARTRGAVGRLIQTDVRAEIINPMTGITVVGDGMVEIELDPQYTVNRGDSGALICVDDGVAVRPYAMLVAAVQKASLPSVKAPTRFAIYALPLAEISALNGLEVW